MGRRVKRAIPVTDPDLDAPDGAVVDGRMRVGDTWHPVRWTKKDIRTLCSQLDSYWLTRSPDRTASSEREAAERLKSVLDGNGRKEVVLAGLRGMRELHASRYNQECQTIGNALVRNIYGAGRDEFVERFVKFARETDKAWGAYEALVLRVVREGLPPEVVSYDPTKR